ncbi:uncharacterized protein LOC107839113 isoform X4 [Capsicum annuum]|uniref:uncharacterized protein LOC107839113 isoform X4 n=1 Tax=Capsicum annuum TaxID=4072 RepID=UPI001FB153C2|nr:uncharacterized protein LOC107839113 isoform X4 [Capsicum annuum]
MMSEFPASMPAVLAEASLLTGSDDHAASISPRICHLFLYFSKLIIHYYILVLQGVASACRSDIYFFGTTGLFLFILKFVPN